ATIAQLAENGIHIDNVTSQVLDEGIVKFDESLDQLLECIESKRAAMESERAKHESANLQESQRPVDLRLTEFAHGNVVNHVWAKDASLWSAEPNVQKAIKNRLGWLTVTKQMAGQLAELREFTDDARHDGFTDAVLCGMGGSSLGVEVLKNTFGKRGGYLALHVLDTTDPVTVAKLSANLDLSRTLFVIASKSGSTAETNAHFKFFWERVPDGRHFVAITDPGTVLEALAVEHHFRHVFSNPPDIGGRYSVLSYFGLVCGALLGVDLELLVGRAEQMRRTCSACVNSKENPGLWLGVVFGELAKRGRDKITIITSHGIDSFAGWAEQLIAESTGKQGKGIVPVAGETLAPPAEYGHDRLFVYLRLEGSEDGETETRLAELTQAGHPVIRLYLADPYDIGGEFFRWEFATAIASAVIGVNAFDEPNVTESKENTQRVLKQGGGPTGDRPGSARFEKALLSLLDSAKPGDYFAFMAYLTQTDANDFALSRMRLAVRNRLKIATTMGYGPRFLHSTGKLHKGGANNVLAFQITSGRAQDEPIPGEAHTFG
ncbi:MAG TPA: transaldolase, partial [Anaerolineae bacterium]